MSLEGILERVAKDSGSGAATTFDYVITEILERMDSGMNPSSNEWSDFALRLFRLRSTMAPIFHLTNCILRISEGEEQTNRERYHSILEAMQAEERIASKNLSVHAAQALDGDSFLTLSSSSSVLSTLMQLSQKRTIKVTVLESLPGGEGLDAARLLSRNGIDVSVLEDSLVFEGAKRSDAALCGADWISPEGVVNKVGTYALAAACDEAGIGCHVLASWSKCAPFPAQDRMRRVYIEEGVKREEQIFELVPIRRFSSCINENGQQPLAKLVAKIKSMPMAQAWKGAIPDRELI